MTCQFIAPFFTLIIGISLINAEFCPAQKKEDWSYRRDLLNGPAHWGDTYPYCYGKKQSPINIKTADVVKLDGPQRKVQIKNFDVPLSKVSVRNNKLILINPADNVTRTVTVDGDNSYTFFNFHFHWGNKSNFEASEHAIDDKKWPMEGHFLFMHPNQTFAVVSNLFELSDEKNPAFEKILKLQPHLTYLKDTYEGDANNINLRDLVDVNCPYYRYSGSAGFPTCVETVTWMICKTHKKIHKSQLEQFFNFRSVKKEDDVKNECHTTNVYRPLQATNGRKVYS